METWMYLCLMSEDYNTLRIKCLDVKVALVQSLQLSQCGIW